MAQRKTPYTQMRETPSGSNCYIYTWKHDSAWDTTDADGNPVKGSIPHGTPMSALIPGLSVREQFVTKPLAMACRMQIESCGNKAVRVFLFQNAMMVYSRRIPSYGGLERALTAAQDAVGEWMKNNIEYLRIAANRPIDDGAAAEPLAS